MNKLLISRRASLSRNFSDLPFPNKMDKAQRETGLARVSLALYSGREVFKQVYKGDGIGLSGAGFFASSIEDILSKENVNLFENSTGNVFVIAGDEDCVKVQSIFEGEQDKAIYLIENIASHIFKAYSPAYDPQFGYLTARPALAGTGIELSALIHLPVTSLLRQVSSAKKTLKEETNCVLSPISKGRNPSCLYEIKCMGEGADSMKESLDIALNKLYTQESLLAKRVLSNPRSSLYDKIHRAYGVLCHARRITMEEFLSLWSLLRLGAENKAIDISIEKVDSLLKPSSRVHERLRNNSNERNYIRADEIRRLLKEE